MRNKEHAAPEWMYLVVSKFMWETSSADLFIIMTKDSNVTDL